MAIRNVRRDGLKGLTEAKRQKQISEDEFYSAKDDLQELTDEHVRRMEELGEKKQAEIMEI